MPRPQAAGLGNPIAEFAKTGVGARPRCCASPTRPINTTARCRTLKAVAAKTYDVWVSPYADEGRGALHGYSLDRIGQLIRASVPTWSFTVSLTDMGRQTVKPSEPLKFTLRARFGYK
jgi:hypothetical protein